ncbi:MAG: hypothetical protein H6658_21655, partial [Ardenticatenaceae bacterium]|nr:hypothetical protein [Ardenticatenaceae bacterium]
MGEALPGGIGDWDGRILSPIFLRSQHKSPAQCGSSFAVRLVVLRSRHAEPPHLLLITAVILPTSPLPTTT